MKINFKKLKMHMLFYGIKRIISNLLFDSYIYYRLKKRHHVLVCGDSHANVFRYIQRNHLLRSILFKVVVVGGATAQGMVNPNSKTNALNIFFENIAKRKKWQEVFFLLGEVDCGFVIWYYAEKYGISLEDQISRSLTNYRNMLLEIKNRMQLPITVISAPLPTIKDGQSWGEVADARKEIKATLKERVSLTIKYNLKLKELCRELDIFFLDATTNLFDDRKEVIDDRFLNKNKLDHQLDDKMYAEVIINSLKLTKRYD